MRTLHSISKQPSGIRLASALARLPLRTKAPQLGVVFLFLAIVAVFTFAATPPSGTLTDTSGPVTYTAGPFAIANPSSTANGQVGAATPTCNPPSQPCDDFALTVNVSAATTSAQLIKIKVNWPTAAAQFDTYVLDSSGGIIGASLASNQGVDPDLLLLPAVSGTYTVRVVPYAPLGQSITATISLVNKTPASPPASGAPPRFQNYIASPGLGTNAGEPSVGCDWNPNVTTLKHDTVNTGGVTFFTSGPNELRASFDDCSSPARDLWEDISSPFVIQSALSDPIGFVDHQTGRVFQLDLIGGQGNSFAGFSDDDGNSWKPMGGGGLPAGPDHETLGAGPYTNFNNAVYPNAVYYCSQNIVGNAECSRSDNGGVTFGPGVVIFQDLTQCVGSIHGHVKVAPDGTVYVPNSSCGAGDASTDIQVSTDNGVTWTSRTVPGSVGFGDPSLGIGQNNNGRPVASASNTIYLGWVNGDGHPDIAVSHDRGLTWRTTYDVGVPFRIKHSNFATVTAGDDNRAAFGFLGTPADGDPEDPNFPGNWHFYIATTYDGGNTWATIDATPNNPVQLGGICTLGFTCSGGDRNLLDFNDITVDSQGRIVAAYAAGCVAPGCNASSPTYASRNAKASILRQSGGRRLFAAFDPSEPALPGAPRLDSVTRLTTGVDLKWSAPDNGGSPLTGYTIYRSTVSGQETTLLTVGTSTTEYLDTTADPNTNYYYQVSATNGIGPSARCGELQVTGPALPPRGPDSCNGFNVVIDEAGDATNPAAPRSAAGNLDTVDILAISFSLDATKTNLVTTMQLKNLSLVPINGTTSTAYNVVWQSSDGKIYASQATFPNANGTLAYLWGEYNPNTNAFVSSNTTTGSFVMGPNGTVSVNVPLSGIGNPTIPITDPNATAAVNNPYGLTIVGEGPLLGGGLTFIQPADRAPDSGFGQRWAVCPSTSGQATHYSISAPAGTTPGAAFSVTVTALDASGNVATSYRGTAQFTSSDSKASLPGNYTFTSSDAGVHSFSVTLQTVGNQTITATDTANSSITATTTVDVSTITGSDPCISPTTVVITDPTGDQTGSQAGLNTQLDIQSVSVAENYHYIGHQNLVFTLKVANLNSIPPSSTWRVAWTFGATTYYVGMNSDVNSLVTFDYGTSANSISTSSGGLDAGSYSSDGTITMVIGMSKVGGPTASSSLTAMNATTQTFVGAAGTGLLLGIDDTSNGSPANPAYTLVGQNTACHPVPVTSTINPTYVKGGMNFSPNFTVRAPYIGQDVEPGIRTDRLGNTYVSSIRGVPAGTDLWYFDLQPTIPDANGHPIANPNYDPNMRNPQYRGQPDGIQGGQEVTFGGDGGGDVAAAVGFGSPSPGAPPILAWTSLVAGNVSAQKSTDKGVTFTQNPAGNVTGGIPVDDRQWIEFFGPNTVYLIYRTLEPAVTQIQQSINGGLTYGPATTAGAIGQVGGVSVDQNDGTVYLSGSTGQVAVGIPPAAGLPPVSYTVHQVSNGSVAHLFFTVKVASDGTAYVCYSDDQNIFIQYSKDKGNTWSPPIRVSDGADTLTSVFPWMETGPVPGTIGVVWYGTDKPTNDDPDNWKVFYALGTNVTTSTPTFQQVVASDHIIHAGNISESGLVIAGKSPNRNLADYFQVSFDPLGAAVIAFTDDHNDIAGHTYVTRQISGNGVNGTSVPAPVEGSALPPPKPFSTDGSQVIDDRDDVRNGGNPQTGGLIVIHTDDPLDILSIKYSVQPSGNDPLIVATMKVSNLSVVPPSSNWRMNFTANAPMTQIAPPGDYDFGISDRGDQFFLRATTDTTGTVQSFVYGTAVRNFDGSITYTDQGNSDSGTFDTTNNTITAKVALSKLNALLGTPGHPTLTFGSLIAGLRGQTFTTTTTPAGGTGNNRQDTARGGTQFVIDTPPTAVLKANPTSGFAPLTVSFDGSGSNNQDGAAMATYTFTFGDGSPSVTQSSPTIPHKYMTFGTYTATLTVTDSFGVQSTNAASVVISVDARTTAVLTANPTSGPDPLVVNFNGSGSSDPDTSETIASYTFMFGDGSSVSQPGSTTSHTYRIPGKYTATLTVTDSNGVSSDPASVLITVMDNPPMAADESATTDEDTPVTITLSATDVDSPRLTFSIVTGPSHGTLGAIGSPTCTPMPNGYGSTCTAPVTYTPGFNYSGPDSFTYKANDGMLDSNVATVSITVNKRTETTGEVEGGGEIAVSNPSGKGEFGFEVERDQAGGSIEGHLDYENEAKELKVRSTSITSFSVSGNKATFTGYCTKNGVACTFVVTVVDNGEPGKGKDWFTISVSGEPVQGSSAPIIKGNIEIENQ